MSTSSLQQHRAESLVSRQNLALCCRKSSTVIYIAQLSRAAVVILRAKWWLGDQESRIHIQQWPEVLHRILAEPLLPCVSVLHFWNTAINAMRAFLLPSSVPRAVLSFATLQRTLWHTSKRAIPGASRSPFPLPSTGLQPYLPWDSVRAVSPGSQAVPTTTYSRAVMSSLALAQSPWALVPFLCAADNRAPWSHRRD